MISIKKLHKEIKKRANSKQAKILQRFFKTAKGEYGEGDVFLGIKVPIQRKIARKYADLSLNDLEKLISSKIHEHRLISLFILIDQYKKGGEQEKKKIFNFYIKHSNYINNWDLVDISAPKIIGDFLLDKKRNLLYRLARSKNLWQKRIAIISTYAFIRNNQFSEMLKISEILLRDKHDLIHKALGWMLRELGKRDQKLEESFLRQHYQKIPRTMLRYAIEKFSQKKRKFYLKNS